MIRRKKTTIFTDAKDTTTVAELKKIIEGILKVSHKDQKLFKDSVLMEDDKTMSGRFHFKFFLLILGDKGSIELFRSVFMVKAFSKLPLFSTSRLRHHNVVGKSTIPGPARTGCPIRARFREFGHNSLQLTTRPTWRYEKPRKRPWTSKCLDLKAPPQKNKNILQAATKFVYFLLIFEEFVKSCVARWKSVTSVWIWL